MLYSITIFFDNLFCGVPHKPNFVLILIMPCTIYIDKVLQVVN